MKHAASGTSIEDMLRWAELGRRIRSRRESLRLTQVEVARHVGWESSASLSELERGSRSTPDLGVWVRLADILQLDATTLLDWVWKARGRIELKYPDANDERRNVVLALALAQESAHYSAVP
jgi:transcriptional regulator with XRE-family HTH domain